MGFGKNGLSREKRQERKYVSAKKLPLGIIGARETVFAEFASFAAKAAIKK